MSRVPNRGPTRANGIILSPPHWVEPRFASVYARFVAPLVRASLTALLLAVICGGCASGQPHAHSAAAPPQASARDSAAAAGSSTSSADADLMNVRSGAGDSVAALPGSPDALYRFRFTQVLPASDRFTFQDRDLSFYFKPTPDALHFQVENRQSRPVVIDWERSVFLDPDGGTGKVAHATSTWRSRFDTQGRTQISGLQRYSDYVFPMSYLVDPGGRDEQLHRPLFPEDSRAPQYADREFGVQLAFLIEDRPRSYEFHFRVASVIPR